MTIPIPFLLFFFFFFKFGPANKILDAREVRQAQNASKIDKNGNCCSSDEGDEVAAESVVLFR